MFACLRRQVADDFESRGNETSKSGGHGNALAFSTDSASSSRSLHLHGGSVSGKTLPDTDVLAGRARAAASGGVTSVLAFASEQVEKVTSGTFPLPSSDPSLHSAPSR